MTSKKRVSFSKTSVRVKPKKLELIPNNVLRPTLVQSIKGSLYFIIFIDDHIKKVWVYFLKWKSNVFDIFKKWKVLEENEIDCKVKCLRSDNNNEFHDKRFKENCASNDIMWEFIVSRTSS